MLQESLIEQKSYATNTNKQPYFVITNKRKQQSQESNSALNGIQFYTSTQVFLNYPEASLVVKLKNPIH